MSEKLKESLSAVIDGEADEFELRRVLDEIGKDSDLAVSWARYHLIGSVMRRERVARSTSMREQIWAEVQTESVTPKPTLVAEQGGVAGPASSVAFGRWTSLAVAATVAIAVVVGFSDLTGFVGDSAPTVAASGSSVERQQQAINQAVALKDEVTDIDQTRTQAYMISHIQQLGMNQPGLGGFAKMVAYEKD